VFCNSLRLLQQPLMRWYVLSWACVDVNDGASTEMNWELTVNGGRPGGGGVPQTGGPDAYGVTADTNDGALPRLTTAMSPAMVCRSMGKRYAKVRAP